MYNAILFYMSKYNLILRAYRVSREDDKIIKKHAKKNGGESAYVRKQIRAKCSDQDCAICLEAKRLTVNND